VGALGRPDPIASPPTPYAEVPWEPSTGQAPALATGLAEPETSRWHGDDPATPGGDAPPADGVLAGDEIDDEALAAAPAGVATAPRRLLRDNVFVASGTLVSRITGLVRTSLIFALLIEGLSDAYLNANNTPNMIYELILGGVLTATLVPLFTDDIEHGRRGDATSAIISFAVVALVVVALLAAAISPLLILLLSTGSPDTSRDDYLRAGIPLALLFAPQVFFYGLMAVWSAVLNARRRFLAAAWAPVLNNVIAIATLITVWLMVDGKPTLADALADRTILLVLGIGTTTGIAAMALALYPSIRRADLDFRFRFDLKHPAVRRAVRLSGWTFGYVIANQVAVLIITILSEPGSGGSTQYQTAYQFFQLPHGLLAVSIMVTFEPLLGRADARGDRQGFNDQVLLGFRLIGLLIIPAAVGYVALPRGLDHRTFVATGDLERVLSLTGVIAGFAVGLPGFSSYLYALRAFYAMKDTRRPFLINCFENAVNVVAAVVLVRIWGIVGLALAFALAYTVAAVVATAVLVRRSPGFDWRALLRTWSELLLAAGVMGACVFGVVVLLSPGSPLMVVPTVLAGVVVGGIVYFATIYALRVEGISELLGRLPGLRRFART
jgi:putative peptidoglycan lipid II flippase